MDVASVASPAGSWDTYWQGAGRAQAFGCGGVEHPSIREFWDDLFRSTPKTESKVELLDVATGNGAVVEAAIDALGDRELTVTCVDVSKAAIASVTAQFPEVHGVVADAARMPFPEHGFDLVTSQFGVEYAGIDAIFRLPMHVAPGGSLAMLLHYQDGAIQEESALNLQAVRRLQDARFLPLAEELFARGFAAVQGGDRKPYDLAGEAFAPAILAVEQILTDLGEHVAGDTIIRLYNDVARIHSAMPRYAPQEVLEWLRSMDIELVAYAGRMQSMLDAVIDREGFDDLCNHLRGHGFCIVRAQPLVPEEQERPLAWVLVAKSSG